MSLYGFFAGPAPTPEWMRAERYEYCDMFSENTKGNEIEGLKKLFSKLFR